MSNLNLNKTNYDFNIYESQRGFSASMSDYVYHNVAVWNDILIGENKYHVEYQTGHGYYCNDYNAPINEFVIYEDGTDSLINLIDSLTESMLSADDDAIHETLKEVKEIEPQIDTLDKLWNVYAYINDNIPILQEIIDTDIYTDNPEDYNVDPEFGYLTPKN